MKGIKIVGRFASGNPRCYYRAAGGLIPLPDLPMNDQGFLAAYLAAEKGEALTKPAARYGSGTIGAGVAAFLASDAFLARADSTRAAWRRGCGDIASRYGGARVADLQPRHIATDLSRLSPNPANNRLKLWRALCRFWQDVGLTSIDAARPVRKRQAPASDGHTPWTDDDCAAFRARWPIGTPQRLAFELARQTGAAVVDLVALGPGHVRDGWLTYTRSKSGTICTVPMLCPPLPWYPDSADLRACLDRAPRHMTWLTTAQGASRSHKATSQWFSAAARAAGIEGKGAHGLRKWLAIYMAERGATPEQRMAILGHESSAQTRAYSKTADARRIIAGTDFGKSTVPVSKTR